MNREHAAMTVVKVKRLKMKPPNRPARKRHHLGKKQDGDGKGKEATDGDA